VHALPSLQPVPFARAGFEHAPVPGSHEPAAWHWSLAAQETGLAAVHVPAWQLSPSVHALPSLQPVPFASAGFEHAPVLGSHEPAAWHWSLAAQETGLPPVHVPPWQLSPRVHALPSLQPVPFASAVFEHAPVPGLHEPAAWHWSLAAHVTELPPVHVPAWQLSPSVHALPSLHTVPFAATGFEQVPVLGLHVPAVWHASLAVHVTALPAVHVPA
jgi:hypothetical protein